MSALADLGWEAYPNEGVSGHTHKHTHTHTYHHARTIMNQHLTQSEPLHIPQCPVWLCGKAPVEQTSG